MKGVDRGRDGIRESKCPFAYLGAKFWVESRLTWPNLKDS